jgi:hypothetical protein
LCSHIAELTPHAEEQIILLFERDSVFAVLGYLRFQCFLVSASVISGKGANQKRIISRVTKAGHHKVCPLDIPQSGIVVHGIGKEDARGKKRHNKGPRPGDGLACVHADLAIFWGSTDREEGVSCSLERG